MDIQWLILTLVLGVLAGLGGGYAAKWQQAKKLLRELGEALQSAGLAMVTSADALDDDRLDESERKRISQAIKDTGSMFSGAFATAAKLIQRE